MRLIHDMLCCVVCAMDDERGDDIYFYLMCFLTASWRCSFDRGENLSRDSSRGGMTAHTVGDIDPNEPSNINRFFALDFIQVGPHNLGEKDVAP